MARTLAERREAKRRQQTWGPDRLYHGRLMERRIMLLELMVWGIDHLETRETQEEAEAFFKELRATRERTWGLRPWKGLKDEATGELSDEQFEEHVLNIAETFAYSESVAEAWYPNRTHQPDGAKPKG